MREEKGETEKMRERRREGRDREKEREEEERGGRGAGVEVGEGRGNPQMKAATFLPARAPRMGRGIGALTLPWPILNMLTVHHSLELSQLRIEHL